MTLEDTLQKQSYDLIQGPVRDQELLQIWRKPKLDTISIYGSLVKVFKKEFQATAKINHALNLDSSIKTVFDFNAGIKFLEDALAQFNIPNANIGNKIKGGKTITISYDNSFSQEYELVDLIYYFTEIDVHGLAVPIKKDLNNNNFIVITGLVFAKNLKMVIDTNSNIEANLETELSNIGNGNLKAQRTADNQISMNVSSDQNLPIAIKAFRIKYEKDNYKDLICVTDNRDFFS